MEFERDGQTWVRFDVVNKKEERATIELPLLRQATIKRHFGKRQYRHVVMLGICLGSVYKETQVTLVDREGFLYDMLLGRSFLKGDFIPRGTLIALPERFFCICQLWHKYCVFK